MKSIRTVNDTGISLAGEDFDRIADIRVYSESGSIQFWVELSDGREYLQYLSPELAMSFSKAFERLAIQALRESYP